MRRDAEFNCRDFARTFLPSAEQEEVDAAVADALRKPKRYCADTLAERLGVTWSERCLLRLDTVGAVDMPKADRLKLSQQTKRERDRAKIAAARRFAGTQTRRDYEKNSDAEFCREYGINPRTFRDWKTKGVLEERLAERGIKTNTGVAAVRRACNALIDATDLGKQASTKTRELLAEPVTGIRSALDEEPVRRGRRVA